MAWVSHSLLLVWSSSLSHQRLRSLPMVVVESFLSLHHSGLSSAQISSYLARLEAAGCLGSFWGIWRQWIVKLDLHHLHCRWRIRSGGGGCAQGSNFGTNYGEALLTRLLEVWKVVGSYRIRWLCYIEGLKLSSQWKALWRWITVSIIASRAPSLMPLSPTAFISTPSTAFSSSVSATWTLSVGFIRHASRTRAISSARPGRRSVGSVRPASCIRVSVTLCRDMGRLGARKLSFHFPWWRWASRGQIYPVPP